LDYLGLGLKELQDLLDSHTKQCLLKCLKGNGMKGEAVRNEQQKALEQWKCVLTPASLL